MESRKKFLTYTYIYACAGLIFACWLLSFMKNHNLLHLHFDIESLGFVVIGIIALIAQIFIIDSFYFGILLIFTPIAFARSFDLTTMPPTVYILVVFAVLGLAINMILHPRSIKKGVYFFSILVFCVGMCFGGLIKSDAFLNSLFASLVISIAIVFIYIYLVTYLEKHSFRELCHVMIAFSMIMILQTLFFQLLLRRGAMFLTKDAEYGWGCTNNLATMMMLTFPFTIYLTIDARRPIVPFLVIFLGLQALTVLLNYSRGALFAGLIMGPLCLIYAFVKTKDKLLFALYYILILFALFIFFVVLHAIDIDLYDIIWENVFDFDVETLNNRKEIYMKMLEASKDHLLFGRGLMSTQGADLYGVNPDNLAVNGYLWAHNTFIHCLYISGIFGILTMLYHLYTKYYALLKKPNAKKIVTLFGLLASGFYGLIDISYYYVIYMVAMIVLMAFMDYEIEDSELSLEGDLSDDE